ncbi:MAG: sigma-70 family RNA polymerase sigma factor [Dehalococcoidia bacterium]|nr:sigma-70 family RNA polymerase sigma factor [Dehalococcoidia bacterium]
MAAHPFLSLVGSKRIDSSPACFYDPGARGGTRPHRSLASEERPVADPPSSLSVPEERSWVLRAAAGDQEAMGVLYDAYIVRLYRYCLARVGNETDAEDLSEEIFVKVLGAVDGFEWRTIRSGADGASGGGEEKSAFAAWLFRIAHNHVVSFHRRASLRGTAGEVPEWIRDERRGPSELAVTKLSIEEAFEAVERLPEAQRDVIRLRFGAGLSVAETAEALGKQQTNVKVLQHKGIAKLRQLLAEPAADPGSEEEQPRARRRG